MVVEGWKETLYESRETESTYLMIFDGEISSLLSMSDLHKESFA